MSTHIDPGNQVCGNEPRWKLYACFVLLLVGMHLIIGDKVRLAQWQVLAESKTALEEALRWKEGSLALRLNYYEVGRSEVTDGVHIGFVPLHRGGRGQRPTRPEINHRPYTPTSPDRFP